MGYCTSCGASRGEHDQFCGQCGHRHETPTTSTDPSVVPPPFKGLANDGVDPAPATPPNGYRASEQSLRRNKIAAYALVAVILFGAAASAAWPTMSEWFSNDPRDTEDWKKLDRAWDQMRYEEKRGMCDSIAAGYGGIARMASASGVDPLIAEQFFAVECS